MRAESKRALRRRAISGLGAALVLLGCWLMVRHQGEPGIDRFAFRALALEKSESAADTAASVVGAAKIALSLCGLAALCALALGRRWRDCAVILGGLVISQTAAHIAKTAIERPRPMGGLVSAGGYSFPSTTSAIGVAFLFLAIAVARVLPERHRLLTVAGGVMVTVLLGLSFVVLRVHYLTDVLAGWALGWLSFTLCESLAKAGTRLSSESSQ